MGSLNPAERRGFEPRDHFDMVTALAMLRIRPLCHLSKLFCFKDLEFFFCVWSCCLTPESVILDTRQVSEYPKIP